MTPAEIEAAQAAIRRLRAAEQELGRFRFNLLGDKARATAKASDGELGSLVITTPGHSTFLNLKLGSSILLAIEAELQAKVDLATARAVEAGVTL